MPTTMRRTGGLAATGCPQPVVLMWRGSEWFMGCGLASQENGVAESV